ncbi:MAG: amidase [Gammaproteobacteria bacterium]|nr:MAG: amidase [Gammaproteobacteria bacterium]
MIDRTADSLAAALFAGDCTAEEAVATCLERIAARDSAIGAFVSLRADAALAEARILDAHARGQQRGPLHGLPFAAKDVFATADLPTEYGSPLYRGFQPASDAAAVQLLRRAGAILLGKVSTVEFAGVGAIPATRNPHDLERTPGGSSAGSGAAVAGGLVPLALASQTGGSTIRPAAFCGVPGMKPSWGRVSVEGMKPFAPSLDTVGWIAESAELLGRAAAALQCARWPLPPAPDKLRIGYYPTPYISAAEAETLAMLQEVRQHLRAAGHEIIEVTGPPGAEQLNEWQDIVMFGEGQVSLLNDYLRDPQAAHPELRDVAMNARGIDSATLLAASDAIAMLRPQFDAALAGFDAWLSPAVPGVAPLLTEGNGLATFNRLFTALHLPCITLPVPRGPRELPLGLQLIGPRRGDPQLLAVAATVEKLLSHA